MARVFPASTREVIEEWRSGDVVIILATITHPEMSEPVRLANNNEDVVSNGLTYLGFPFKIELPSETDDAPKGRMGIQNVDRRIGLEILSVRHLAPSKLRIQVVLASDPDSVWLDYKNFSLRDVRGDALQITGVIDKRDSGRDPWPGKRSTKADFPNLYR